MVTLTEPAVAKVRELISQEAATEEVVLRFGVRPGGCSGFSYEMYFDSNVDELADMVKEYDGVKIAIDRESLTMVDGATIDYVDGLQGAGFKISNPNVNRACGCGQSFS